MTNNKRTRGTKWRLAFLSLVVTAGWGFPACGQSSATEVSRAVAVAPPSSDFKGLVDIGNGRKIFSEWRGQGGPTVVLIAGKGLGAEAWSLILDPSDPAQDSPGDDLSSGLGKVYLSEDAVFPSVARFTRVLAYDRPGVRFEGADLSTPVPQPHTVDKAVDDLHALLLASKLPGPHVLVSHSYGGLIAALYARRYPESVAGLVMVDAASEWMEDVLSPEKFAGWPRSLPGDRCLQPDSGRRTSAQSAGHRLERRQMVAA